MKQYIRKSLNVLLSLLLGGAILYWMYRDFDLMAVRDVLRHQMNWWWMLASLPFGILAQMFRAFRWRQTLEPLGESPRTNTLVNSIFLSYAMSLIIPRIGEFTRCGVLMRKEGVNFSKALGTVVTERIIDSLIVLIITSALFILQIPIFLSFFNKTGTRFDEIVQLLQSFSQAGYIVVLVCAIATALALWKLRRKMAFYEKVKGTVLSLKDGVLSLRNVKNVKLFIFYSLAIWVSYFLHYYLTFFCFQETSSLSITCAMVTFIIGSVAVLVPTPNGAGSWHFAVKTMLILYGVADTPALYFVLIVHSLQTLLIAVLGIYAWINLMLTPAPER